MGNLTSFAILGDKENDKQYFPVQVLDVERLERTK
jgi:hypothetical protein